MGKSFGAGTLLIALLTLVVPAEAQQAQSTTPPPTPSPQSGAAAPTPVPPAATAPTQEGTQLPPVQVIQKEQAAPQTAHKKAAPKTTPAATAAPITPPAQPSSATFGSMIQMSPVAGSEIPLDKVPGGISTVTASEVAQTRSPALEDILQSRVPGVIISDLQGNDFQTDVQYRGFSASPVDGVPQGLAIYQNGVRINEAFGDTVNWDFLPAIAINGITVISNNPAFGLNAIGGAISLTMKDGFNYHGAEVDMRAGSFGRLQGSVQAGAQSGPVAAYIALEDIHDGGWRQFSPADIRRMYADLGFKNSDAELHINFTGAYNFVGAVTAAPVQLLDEGWNLAFTNPQTTLNAVLMPSINGSVALTDTLRLAGVAYYRDYQQHHVDANISNATRCTQMSGTNLCLDPADPNASELLDQFGNPIPNSRFPGPNGVGEIDRSSQDAHSFGGSLQAVEKAKVFSLGNQFMIGTSYDHGRVVYKAAAELGTFGPNFVITGDGIFLSAPNDISPRDLATTNDYYGAYFSDTLDVTDQLSLTVGGRFNFARIQIEDQIGTAPSLNGAHDYTHFNPLAGATYKLLPGLSLYGGFSESNRAPTPAELSCSDPVNPCFITSFLTADPPLKQVIGQTWETGLRGQMASWGNRQSLQWNLGFYHTLNIEDIIAVASPITGRGFFQNAGNTLRQGIEVGLNYQTDRFSAYAGYNFVDATFQTPLLLPSPNNPSPLAVPCGGSLCINVEPGDHLPGIPAHIFKTGFDYKLTHDWTGGADLVAASSQFFFGDQANLNKPLGGYATVNLHSSYDVNDHVQIYGLINNLFDTHYATFGNYFNTSQANGAVVPFGSLTFTDARTITPAQPFAVYGGLKVKF